MSNSLRTIKRQKDRDFGELPLDQQKLPTGRVVTEPIKGTFLALPLVGWIALRQHADRTPLVMLRLALGEFSEAGQRLRGALEMELPLYVDNELATVFALARFGWTGKIWAPGDDPPGGDLELAEQLRTLIENTPGLRATLLFGPDPVTGNQLAQSVEVTRARGKFLMPPLEEPEDPVDPELVQNLRRLVKGHATFSIAPDVAPEQTEVPHGV